MTVYMTDTHALLWAFHQPRKLGENARRVFDEIANGKARLLIPVIVMAELIFTIENKPIEADLDKIFDAIDNSPNVEFIDFDYAATLKLRTLSSIPEMHDRMIVASAILNGAILITRDRAITAAKVVEVIW